MSSVTELLLLPDGQVLVHNLSPAMAALLKEFDPQDTEIALRASLGAAGPVAGSPPPKRAAALQPCVSPTVYKL